MSSVSFKVQGLEKILHKLEGRVLLGGALKGAFETAGRIVENRAKEKASVDRGQMRASINTQVDQSPIPLWATVGPNVHYAKYVHDGRAPGSFPPVAAIAAWAQRKGIDAPPFVIARAIARKGIKEKPFMRDALAESETAIQGVFDGAAKHIESAWGG